MNATAAAAIVERIAPSGLMKPEQAAEYLQITPSTLAVWRSTNRKKLAYVKVGGHVRYRRADLDQFIADGLRNARRKGQPVDINHTPPERAAILRAILAANIGNDGAKQCARLLEAMQRLGSITTVEAVRFLDIVDPRARKMGLVKAGHQVLMIWDCDHTESGRPHRIGRYSLVKGAQQ